MLTLEDRILRLEILTGTIDKVPIEMAPIDRIKEIREKKGIGLHSAKLECVREYFDKKDKESKNCSSCTIAGTIYCDDECKDMSKYEDYKGDFATH